MASTTDETDTRLSVEESAERADDAEELNPVEVTHAPPKPLQALAVVAALVGVALTAPFTVLAIPFGVAGLAIVGASVLFTYSRGWLTLGVAMILVGTLITGAYGALPVELLLVAVGATVLAWDAGQHGIVLGEQLGREPRSIRSQAVHIAATSFVVGFFAAFAYAVYLVGEGGRPAPAVVVAVVGIIVIAWGLRM